MNSNPRMTIFSFVKSCARDIVSNYSPFPIPYSLTPIPNHYYLIINGWVGFLLLRIELITLLSKR